MKRPEYGIDGITGGTSQFALAGDIRVEDAFEKKRPIPEPTTVALVITPLR
ncbi:hypothetical protein [Nitrosococcus halophilus]|uniref:hypothetical protein n=1 Tax=Nitrosococcus halophilus TaxID=133539 RepID=UPI0002FCFE30|nr:hypothetical protein [Nitrosococcus halophilus]